MKREERNETKKRNERGASCRVNTLVEYTCEPSSRVNRGRRKKQRERELVQVLGWEKLCSQENGSRGYRWCSIDGGALLELWPRTGGKKGASRIWIGKDGERGVKEGRPWNHLIRDFASLEISDRQREVTTGHGDSAPPIPSHVSGEAGRDEKNRGRRTVNRALLARSRVYAYGRACGRWKRMTGGYK